MLVRESSIAGKTLCLSEFTLYSEDKENELVVDEDENAGEVDDWISEVKNLLGLSKEEGLVASISLKIVLEILLYSGPSMKLQ